MPDSSSNYPIISYYGESDGSIVLEGKSSPTDLLDNWPLVLRGLQLEAAGFRTTGYGEVIDSNGYWVGQAINDSAAPTPTYYIRSDQADSAVGPITVDNGIVTSNITVSGTVDGRNVATDGSKLDTIESGATGDLSGSEIKTLYEGEANTNAFTDAEKSKLGGIESGATADLSGSEIKTLYEGEADTNAFTDSDRSKLIGIESGATADQTASELLTAIKTVDGSGSGLDADLWDGNEFASYLDQALLTTSDPAFNDLFIDNIADVGKLKVTGQGGVTASAEFGVEDSSRGSITLYGGVPGSETYGGTIYLHTAANYDSNWISYSIKPEEEDFTIDVTSSLKAVMEVLRLTPAGNLTLAGTVEGRNVATDGAKLDTIESGATGDLSGSEIKTLYEAEANTNAFTDAEKTKVGYLAVTQAVDLDQMETDIAALANGMVYKGDWDASAGTFPGSGSAQTGWFYYVSVGGTVDSVTFAAGDNLVAITDNASTATYASNWSKHDQTDAVTAVVGLTGSIGKASLLSALNVEDGADVTDATNVAAAGALMDSELADSDAVKGLNQGVADTDSPTFVNLTVSGSLTVDTDTLFASADSDKVGVNTSSPDTSLHVVGTSGALSTAWSPSALDTLTIDNAGYASINLQGSLISGFTFSDAAERAAGSYFYSHITDQHQWYRQANKLASLDSAAFKVDSDTLYVDMINNRVGINTVSPDEALEVVGNTKISSGDLSVLSSGPVGIIDVFNSTGTAGGRLVGDSDNKIGLRAGTSGYANVFEIRGDNNQAILLLNSVQQALFTTGGTTLTGDLAVDTNTLYVDASANRVGIGTSAPAAKAHIKNGSSGATAYGYSDFYIEGSSVTGFNFLHKDSNAAGIYWSTPSDNLGAAITWKHIDDEFTLGARSTNGAVSFYAGNSEKARLEANGDFVVDVATDTFFVDASTNRIGVKTSTPNAPMHIIGGAETTGATYAGTADLIIEDSDHANIQLMSNSTTGINSIYFGDPPNPAVGYIAYFHGSNAMSFVTQSSEGARIIGNEMIVGNVASNPATTLDVRAALAGVQIKSSTNQADLYFSSPDTQENRIFFGDVSDFDAASIKYSHSTNVMSFTTNGRSTVDMTLDSGVLTAEKFVGHDYYSAYSNATLTLTTSYQVVPIDTALKSSDGTVFSLSSGRLTVNKTSAYMITLDVTSNITSGAARSETQVELFKNATAVTGTFCAIYNRTLGRGQATGSATVIIDLTAGDIIDIRALKVGADSIDTVSGGCRLLVKEL